MPIATLSVSQTIFQNLDLQFFKDLLVEN